MTATARLHHSTELPALLDRIDALGSSLDAGADAAEDLGRLPDRAARALLDAGIVRAELPKSLGGYEFSPCS